MLVSAEDIETLVEGALTLNTRKLDRLLTRARGTTPSGVPSTPRAPAQLRGLPASKPRSQAGRGAPEQSTGREARLAYLDGKNPLDWSRDEMKEFQTLIKDVG
jgi:hypothetical protein